VGGRLEAAAYAIHAECRGHSITCPVSNHRSTVCVSEPKTGCTAGRESALARYLAPDGLEFVICASACDITERRP